MSKIQQLIANIDTLKSAYERKHEEDLEIIHRLENELNELSTSYYAGGIPNNEFNRGDMGDAFDFPIKWAFTCKRMSSNTYLSPILSFYKSLFNSFDYSIKFNEEDNNTETEKIKKFLERQFKKAGGLKEFVTNIANETLKYGFFYFTPKLDVVEGSYYGLKGRYDGFYDFKFYDPTGLYNFTFDEKDADKLNAISILSAPKKIGTVKNNEGVSQGFSELELLKNLSINQATTQMNIINIDVKSALMGYVSYGDITGNPIGKPFLYDVYSLWQIMDSMDSSFNKNLENIGEHSFNFVSSKTEGLDDSEKKEIQKEIKTFVNAKGGVFLSKYGKLEKIEGIDGKKWNDIRDGIIATIWKCKGADIKALGMTKGATKNLASFAQTDGVIIASSIIKDVLRQINKTFLKSYFDLNFKDYINKGDTDYPEIVFELLEEIATENETGESSPATTQLSSIIETEIIKQEKSKTVYSVVKKEPEGIEKEIIFDIGSLDTFLENNINTFASELNLILRPKLKETVAEVIKNPRKQLNVWGVFDKKRFEEEIKNVIEEIVKKSAIEQAKYIASSFRIGNTKFEEELNTDEYTYAINIASKYIKSLMFKDIVNSAMLEAETLIRDYAVSKNAGFVLTDKNQIHSVTTMLQERVENLKGRDFYNLAKNITLKTFTNVSDYENRETLKKVNDYAVIRSGVLEGQCEHCTSRIGKVYYFQENGELVSNDGEVLTLPDPLCKGRLGGNSCRCFTVVIPALTFSENTVETIS